jgi:hypothetical protein
MEERNKGNKQNGAHPAHPVRDVFFCILCILSSFSFCYLWIAPLFVFPYREPVAVAAIALLAFSLVFGVVAFFRSHRAYFAYKRSKKK